MRRTAVGRRAAIGLLVGYCVLRGSAWASAEPPAGVPVVPTSAAGGSPSDELAETRGLTMAGIAVYAAGALYDLYTTKRAMDAGLHEANPLLSASGDPGRTLARGAVAKIGFAFAIGAVGRRRGGRARGTLLLSVGALQLGLGIANRDATVRERATAPVGPSPNPLPPPADPLRPIGAGTSLTGVKRKGSAAGTP